MKNSRAIDYDYIAKNISSLSQICVRVYKENSELCSYDPSGFPVDPCTPYIQTLLKINGCVNYYISPFEHFYGIVKHDNYTLILGPTFQITPPRNEIREFMFSIGIKGNYMDEYQRLIATVTPMPLELFLRELCLIYYYISDNKLNVADVAIYDSASNIMKQNKEISRASENKPDKGTSLSAAFSGVTSFENESRKSPSSGAASGNTEETNQRTTNYEKKLLSYVSTGDLEGLNSLFNDSSAGRAGKIAPTYLRQLKNIFIATATLVSRAAIEGGLAPSDALLLSDRFIMHAESYDNPEQIMNLQYHMVIDYTSRVNEIKKGEHYDKFMRNVTSYVQQNLASAFSIDQMAHDLFISKSRLSVKFKKETGMTLSEYIRVQKIEKAKRLLKSTNRSILEISDYLGFSSQGYFQNVFKSVTGITPREFRNA